MDVAAGLASVRAKIAQACARARRDPASVRLIAVSKTKPLAMLQEAAAAGQRIFGENYAQELREKAEALPGVEWHFIGALQTNKARLVVGRAALIHTCDRLALAQELSKRAKAAAIVQRVLLEVNVGREPQKAGASCGRRGAARSGARASRAGLRGVDVHPAGGRRSARPLPRAARPGVSLGLAQLSMGMSADYEAAIEEGATLVRVGTAIFGERAR